MADRTVRFACALVSLLCLTGCYTLQPVRTAGPILGATYAFDINDAGRVALGGVMGPEIGQVEGRLVSQDATEYVVAVSVVRMLRDAEQNWTGERVHLKTEYVRGMQERQLSKGRSFLLGGAAVASVAFMVTRAIVGAGQGEPPKTPGDSVISTRIPVWP